MKISLKKNLFVALFLSAVFCCQINAQNSGNNVSDPYNAYNQPNQPRFPVYNFPNEKATQESFWRIYRQQAEREIQLLRNKYPYLTFDNMTDYYYDPEVALLYDGIMMDYHAYLKDTRSPVL